MLSAGGRAPSSYWCTARSARACARAQPPGRAPRYRERRAIARRESRRRSFEQQGAEHSLGAWTSARASVATLPPRRLSPSAPPRTARRRRPREQGPLFSPRCRFGFACRGVLITDDTALPLEKLRLCQICYPSSMACFSSSPSSSLCSQPAASRQSAARTTLRGRAGGRAFHP